MKQIAVIILILSSYFSINAQQPPYDPCISQESDFQEKTQTIRPNQDEVESRKIAFLAVAISLTPAEAALFWPEYNAWNKKLETNMKARHEAFREIRQLNRDKKGDEKAYSKLSQILIKGTAEEANIVADAHKVYVSILGEIRTAKLYLAEEQFRGQLIRELRQQNAKQQ